MKLLLSTHSKNEKYVDLCITIITELWPEAPELIVCTNKGSFSYQDRVISAHKDWVPMMEDCINQLVAAGRIPEEEPIVLVLEDHIPHAAINNKTILQLADFLRTSGDSYLNLGGYGKGRQKIADVDGTSVYAMDLHTFSSLHPAIWSVQHFRRTLSNALESGISDPWRFERIRLARTCHYTTGSKIWPSTHGGFLWQGKVNVPALKHMKQGSSLLLRRQLFMKLILEIPARISERLLAGRLLP